MIKACQSIKAKHPDRERYIFKIVYIIRETLTIVL